MAYLAELRREWRPLLAATIGSGAGNVLLMNAVGIFGPQLIQEFGWSRAEFALLGSLALVMLISNPIVGRITDLVGARPMAMTGIVALPLFYLAYTLMTGDIRQYMALFVLQIVVCSTTTALVYTRIVVQYVRNSRGLALAIVASGPALTTMIGGPLLNMLVDSHGWRAGYYAMAAFCVIGGAVTLALLPSRQALAAAGPARTERNARRDYGLILRRRAFWIMLAGLLLANIAHAVSSMQMKLVLQESGATSQGVSAMISAFALGVLVGRFACGLAIDRYPAHIVAAIGLAMPSVGLLLLASPLDGVPVLLLAVLLIGLSYGAEGDLVGFLVVRHFGVGIYSSVFSLMSVSIAVAAALGAALISLSLKLTGTFQPFLYGSAAAVLVGGLLFLILGDGRPAEPVDEENPFDPLPIALAPGVAAQPSIAQRH